MRVPSVRGLGRVCTCLSAIPDEGLGLLKCGGGGSNGRRKGARAGVGQRSPVDGGTLNEEFTYLNPQPQSGPQSWRRRRE